MGVNAVACAATKVDAPQQETRRWTTFLGAQTRAPSANEHLATDPQLLWTVDAGKSPSGAMAVGDSTVAIQTSDRRLVLYRRGDGAQIWRRALDGVGGTGPLLAGEWVYAASGGERGRVYAYTLRRGERAWFREVGSVIDPIAARGAHVYAATRSGTVYALSTSTGEIGWQHRFSRPITVGVTVLDRHLVVATEDSLYLVSRDAGVVERGRPTPGTLVSAPAVWKTALVVTSPDGFVTAVDAASLETRWQVVVRGPVFGSPAIARDTVFVTTLEGALWRIPFDGSEAASMVALNAPVRASPTPFAGGVLIATLRGDVLRIEGTSDEARWEAHVAAPLDYPPVLDRGALFVADGTGRIHVWR